jgi:hypothetical protein
VFYNLLSPNILNIQYTCSFIIPSLIFLIPFLLRLLFFENYLTNKLSTFCYAAATPHQFQIQNQRQGGVILTRSYLAIVYPVHCTSSIDIFREDSNDVARAFWRRGYSRPQTSHLLALYSVGLSHHLLHTAMHISTCNFRGHCTWSWYWGSTHAKCRCKPIETEELKMDTYKVWCIWAYQYSNSDHICYLNWLRTVRYIRPNRTRVNCMLEVTGCKSNNMKYSGRAAELVPL